MFVNPFPKNSVKTTKIHCVSYDKIPRIDPAHRNSDPPCVYISVVNESYRRLFSSWTLCIRLSHWLLVPVQQRYAAGRSQLTLFMDFEYCRLLRSGKWHPGYRPRAGFHSPHTFIRYIQSSLLVQSWSCYSIQKYKFQFADSGILDVIHRTYFDGI